MTQELINQLDEKWEKAISNFQSELGKVRTGRAAPSILDTVKVDYYGTITPLSQMASITAPEPRLLMIQPWDQSAIEPIEKAIQTSDLGIVPQNDGKIIRLPIPDLTEERRKKFVKLVNKQAEESRIAIRNIRRSGMDELKRAEKDKEISEDEQKKSQIIIQEKTDAYIKKVDQIAEKKSQEILEV